MPCKFIRERTTEIFFQLVHEFSSGLLLVDAMHIHIWMSLQICLILVQVSKNLRSWFIVSLKYITNEIDETLCNSSSIWVWASGHAYPFYYFVIFLLNFVTHSSVLSKKGPSDDHQSSLEIAVSHLYWQ